MALLTFDQCRTHLRADSDATDDELDRFLMAAEDAAAAYLNRAIFPIDADRVNALQALPAQVSDAMSEYEETMAAADAEPDAAIADTMRAIALAARSEMALKRNMTIEGIVSNPSIVAAVLLTLGHLWANRESVVTGAGAIELPLGVKDLLRPYRRVMMP